MGEVTNWNVTPQEPGRRELSTLSKSPIRYNGNMAKDEKQAGPGSAHEVTEALNAPKSGFMKGHISVPADFDSMDVEEISASFEGHQ